MTESGHLPAVVDDHEPPAYGPNGAHESDLVLWAYEAAQTHKIALVLAKTSFVPNTMQGKPYDITAAIMAGHELGLQPMAALRSMDIINGNVFMRAHMMRGLVMSHGHRVWVEDASPTRVDVCGQRRESALTFGAIQTVTWTMDRAAAMGLTGKAEWKKQPQTMLIARATAEMCRLIAADVLFAMPYATEEADGVPGATEEKLTLADLVEPKLAAPKRTAKPTPKPKYEPGKAEPITEGPLVDQPMFDEPKPVDETDWPDVAGVQ